MSSALNIEIVIPQLAEKGGLDQVVNDFADSGCKNLQRVGYRI